MSRTGCVLVVVLCVLTCSFPAHPQDCQIAPGAVSVTGPDAVIHGGNGSTVLKAQNPQKAKAKLQLTVGAFVNQTSQSLVDGATVELAPGDGTKKLPALLAPQQSTDILAKISKLGEAGLSSARLFNNGNCVGVLRAINYDAPLNITVEGDGTGTSTLQVREGTKAALVLKNNDALTYATTLSLSFEGAAMAIGPVIFGPNSTRIVEFQPDSRWFDFREAIRPNPAKLLLQIGLVAPAAAANGQAPPEQLAPLRGPVTLNALLASKSQQSYQWISFLIVFIVLFLGGLASLALNTLLPNVLKKLEYQKQLQAVADATSTVSTRVDSRLRVLLRLERNRLAKLLESIGAFAGNSADTYQQVSLGVAGLTKRLTVAQRLDDLRTRFDLGAASWPPSLSDLVDCDLQEAADQLRTLALTDKNIEDATKALDEADDLLSTAESPDTQAKQIAARHGKLLARVATFQAGDYADMRVALPGLFAVLGNTYDDAHPVLPGNFFAVDNAIARIHVALDFVYARAATTDATIRGRLNARQTRLTALLGTLGWRSLKDARHLVQQMEENIYVEDLVAELVADRAKITIDQQVARPYLPVELCICFQNPDHNDAKALNELTCDWVFTDPPHPNLTEKGWSVCHFFQERGDKNVEATIPIPGGGPPDHVTLNKVLPVRERSASLTASRWFAEWLRFAIAFFIALTGLLAGAQDQLAKLDVLPAIIAVFLLGFGADSIKNIFGQPLASSTKP